MSTEERGPDSILDQSISEIRNTPIDPAQERKAAERVWARVSQEAAGTLSSEPETIRTCADFQALIPAWREKRLSPARVMLLEDHLHECPECRKASETGRVVPIRKSGPAMMPWTRWAVAAGIIAVAGLGAYLVSEFAVPGGTGARATVYAADGKLYRVNGTTSGLLAVGAGINEAERIRTDKDGGAVLKLRDGSLVEIAPRTELSLSQRRAGVTVHLDRGAVIVQAAKQRNGHLFVATDDCTVSVKGTIFSVNHGVKGSRVAVAEGLVQVDQANGTRMLHPGEQAATSDALSPVPVEQEFSWSRNFDQYLALLKDFTTIRQKLEAITGPGLRYNSRLMDLAPAGTQFYAAIPNMGTTVSEANRLFHEQMAQSAVLKEWWTAKVQNAEGEAKFNEMLDRLRVFSGYLGPEMVLAMSPDATGKMESPLLLAEVTRSGFKDYLAQELKSINAQGKHGGLRIVADPFTAAPAGNDEMLIYATDNLVAAAKDMALLQWVARPAAGAFRGTPFGARVATAYQQGVNWLFCVDLQTIMGREQKSTKDQAAFQASGFGDMRYLVVQRKDVNGQTENRAELTFSQARRGVASWLAAPAPIRALDYISEDAAIASAFAIKEPKLASQDLFRMLESSGGNFFENLAEAEAKLGVDIRSELIAPLGGEIAFALDGPMLPVPSFKIVAEVADSATFVRAIEKLAAAVNRESQGQANLKLTQEQVGGQPFWTLTGTKGVDVHFTFDNGFLVAAPSRDLVSRALKYRTTGYSLARSDKFVALLPRDGNTNFSGMVYHAMGSVLQTFQGQLTAEQQKALKAVAGDAPTLVLFYGEQDRIAMSSRGTFFGLRPEQLLGLQAFGKMKHGAVTH